MASLAGLISTHIPVSLPTKFTSYVPGETPLSTPPAVLGTVAAYLAVIYGIQWLMTDRQPFKLTFLFQTHNILLSAGSLILLLLMLEEFVAIALKDGILKSACASSSSWTSRMEFYQLINYYFKYVELLDTVFLALKKKHMQFLHVYHHSATALLCYTQLDSRPNRPSGSWIIILINLAVHVVMYYYYYATAGGAKIWWKKYLTTLQITQFIVDLTLICTAYYLHIAATYFPNTLPMLLPVDDCDVGELRNGIFGVTLVVSYLALFINFYYQTYRAPTTTNDCKANDVRNGNANGQPNISNERKANGLRNGKANGHKME